MIRGATMQSALLRYLSSKYYYSILSMMMMPKKGMVCFIVCFDNKNISFGEKINSLSQLLRFKSGHFEFFVSKGSFKNDRSTTAQILLWGAIHAKSKEKHTFISKNKATPHDYRTTLILQTKILKNTLCTRAYSGAATERHLLPPEYTRGYVKRVAIYSVSRNLKVWQCLIGVI